MSFDSRELRGRIIARYGSQENFAKAIGKTPTTVSRKMSGDVGFSREEIVQWSELLEIDESDYARYFFAQRVKRI